jgi:7-keto-8-aminopelargonate synthetase-like enzyme
MTETTLAIRPSQNEALRVTEATLSRLRDRGLLYRTAEDERFDGRHIRFDGRDMVNFGSCSYLGLETDPRLKMAACEAVLRYGVQFSSSRAYVTTPLYAEFEALLSSIVGGLPVVLAATTSLAHLAALPVLVGDGDAVLYDVLVHNSVQAVLPTLRQRGILCEPVPHNRLDRLERRVQSLATRHSRVFYLCDGVYSMHGDALDAGELREVLDRNPAMFAYVDDAHGVGWTGQHGAGVVLGRHGGHERMVVALGLAKSFAAAGGVVVVPSQELASRLLTCGSTLIFSGPLQPAQLGAGIASAKIHLSDELPDLQRKVTDRIDAFDAAARQEGLPVRTSVRTPIRFVEVGDEELATELAVHLQKRGYFVNIAMFPVVPRRRAGIRLMLNAHQTLGDIRGLVREIAERLRTRQRPEALAMVEAS